MRKPRPEDFDPKTRKRQPDVIDMRGVVPLAPKEALDLPVKMPAQLATSDPSPQTEHDTVIPQLRGSMVSRNRDTTIFSTQEGDIIAHIRKMVKEFGKEAATHRFTQEEKKMLSEMVYTYKNQRIRTTENEISRIAINYLFYDYRLNGQNSILHKALISLNE